MTIKTFLQKISDGQGPIQALAADLIERMSPEDFEELTTDMQDTENLFTDLFLADDGEEDPAPTCRICGCTQLHACLNPTTGIPCHWIEPNLCSECHTKQPT